MTRVLLLIIGLVTPAGSREWVVGDTLEELARRSRADGPAAATRWLWRETGRLISQSIRESPAAPASPPRDRDRWYRSFAFDLRYAGRLLMRAPGFATVAVATLGLAIGGTVAMFAVVNGVLLKPLPFHDPDRLMLVHVLAPDDANPTVLRETVWSFPKYRTLMEAQQVFERAALFNEPVVSLTGDGDPERVPAELVTEDYAAVVGAAVESGRFFTSEEASQRGAAPVAVLGHGLWTRRFGADPHVVGKAIMLNDVSYVVVGILPRGFQGLSGRAQLWLPLGTVAAESLGWAQDHAFSLIARRRAGVTVAAAIAAVHVAGARVEEVHGELPEPAAAGRARWSATARSLQASRADIDVRRASWLLFAAVAVLLVIACVNLMNLVGARALARRHDVALRLAIGAGRARILRQFVADGLVLGAAGAAAGVAIGWALMHAAARLLPVSDVFFGTAIAPGVPRTGGAAGLTRIGASMIAMDAQTIAFAAAMAFVTAMCVSLWPAWQVSAQRPSDALRGGRSASDRGRPSQSFRSLLVTVQIALALVLLAGAGLMVRSGLRLLDTSLGVTAANVLTVPITLPARRYNPVTGAALVAQFVERLRLRPDVESVGLGNCLPVSGGCNSTFLQLSPAETRWDQGPLVGVYWADSSYFATLGIQILHGRGFTADDRTGRPKVAIVSRAAAQAVWPTESPLGKTIRVGQGGFQDGAEIVGVVSDVRYDAIESGPTPDVYLPLSQSYRPTIRVFIRGRGDVEHLAPALAQELHALDASLPLGRIKTLETQVQEAMWRTRVGAWLLSAFAVVAVMLTAIGIFGVMTETVAQRTPEIGIRVALGADRRDVLKLMLGRAMVVTGLGVVAGLAISLALTRTIRSLLYEISPADPLTLCLVSAGLAVVAVVASYVPARRATRVDAVVALRAD